MRRMRRVFEGCERLNPVELEGEDDGKASDDDFDFDDDEDEDEDDEEEDEEDEAWHYVLASELIISA